MKKISKLKCIALNVIFVSTVPVHAGQMGKRALKVALGVGVTGVAGKYGPSYVRKKVLEKVSYKEMKPEQEQVTRAYIKKICPNFSDSRVVSRRWITSETIGLREIELNPVRKIMFKFFDLLDPLLYSRFCSKEVRSQLESMKSLICGKRKDLEERLLTMKLAWTIHEWEEGSRELRRMIVQRDVGKESGSIEQIKLKLTVLKATVAYAESLDRLRINRGYLKFLLEFIEQGEIPEKTVVSEINLLEHAVDCFKTHRGATLHKRSIIALQSYIVVGSPGDRLTGENRFTIAHELGHYRCHEGLPSTEEKNEIEADFEAMKMMNKYDVEGLKLCLFDWVKWNCGDEHLPDPYLRMDERPLFLYWYRQEKDKFGFNPDKFLAQYIKNRDLIKTIIKEEVFLGNYKIIDAKLCRKSVSGGSALFADEEGFEQHLECDVLKVIDKIEQRINVENVE